MTALQGIRDQGKLPTLNAHVLITGVSGAVGSTGILVAKKLGAKVTAVGSQRGLELAKRLGADVIIDRKGGDIVEKTNSSYSFSMRLQLIDGLCGKQGLKPAALLSLLCHR